MTKVLLFGDLHLMDRPRASLTETYTDDLFDMLASIANLEKELGVDSVVCAGDFFEYKNPARTSHALVLRTIEAARKFDNLWVVTGNHDISNDVLDSVYEKQPLGVLYASGAAKELVGWHPDLPICGIPWQQRWLQEGAVEEAFGTYALSSAWPPEKTLAITHAPIIPPELDQELYETLNVDEVAQAMAGAGNLYYGHIHEDHGVWEHGGVTFANVGALSRGSLHEYNVNRKIQVCLWEDDKGFTPIEIPHRPASEVFHLETKATQVKEKLSLDAFLGDIGSTTLSVVDTGSVVAYIRGLDIDTSVKNKAIALIEEQ